MDSKHQGWKAKEKELRKGGQMGTIMKAFVNKTSQPPSFAVNAPKSQPRQIRVPRSPLVTRGRPSKFVRDERDERLAVRRRSIPSEAKASPESEPEIKLEESFYDVSISHALAEHAFTAKRVLFSDFPMPKKGAVSNGIEYCGFPAIYMSLKDRRD